MLPFGLAGPSRDVKNVTLEWNPQSLTATDGEPADDPLTDGGHVLLAVHQPEFAILISVFDRCASPTDTIGTYNRGACVPFHEEQVRSC